MFWKWSICTMLNNPIKKHLTLLMKESPSSQMKSTNWLKESTIVPRKFIKLNRDSFKKEKLHMKGMKKLLKDRKSLRFCSEWNKNTLRSSNFILNPRTSSKFNSQKSNSSNFWESFHKWAPSSILTSKKMNNNLEALIPRKFNAGLKLSKRSNLFF